MTIDQIKERIEEIRSLVGDPEAAHSKEDDLYRDFIRYVALGSGGISIVVKARLVLTVIDIKFPRWHA